VAKSVNEGTGALNPGGLAGTQPVR
jgi:hypothetical protein